MLVCGAVNVQAKLCCVKRLKIKRMSLVVWVSIQGIKHNLFKRMQVRRLRGLNHG